MPSNGAHSRDDASELPHEEKPRKFDLYTFVVATIVSLLVAGVGSVTTIATTNATIAGDREARREELRNTQLESARVKREVVYEEYLDAANEYSVATNNLLDVCTPSPDATAAIIAASCPLPNYSEFNTARNEYQGKLNEVYVFGTPEAVASARSISQLLPAGLVSYLPKTPITRPDPVEFLRRYQAFTDIQCRDVRIDREQPCL